MNDRRKRSDPLRPDDESQHEGDDKAKTQHSTGIDNRDESVRRYGNLEPEGYTRHVHGDREGEFQRGKKAETEVPLEESAPFKETRFRKDKNKRSNAPDQYGGRTYNDLPGDHDIIDDLLKKPPTPGR